MTISVGRKMLLQARHHMDAALAINKQVEALSGPELLDVPRVCGLLEQRDREFTLARGLLGLAEIEARHPGVLLE